MKNWKQFTFTVVFLIIGGTFYVNAQDMIVLKDGNMIDAKVEEISQTEIRYKRFDHLDGPVIVIPAVNVLSIRYENGNYEIINAGTMPRQSITQAENPAAAPDKLTFGINANAGGALAYIWEGGAGAGINIELGKGKFNTQIDLMIPYGGFGILVTLNGFWPSQIGGFYLGGGIGFSLYERFDYSYRHNYYDNNYYRNNMFVTVFSFPLGLNTGYKFITKSGLYFRTGAFVAFDFGCFNHYLVPPIYVKPDLAIGWTRR